MEDRGSNKCHLYFFCDAVALTCDLVMTCNNPCYGSTEFLSLNADLDAVWFYYKFFAYKLYLCLSNG